MVRLTKVQRKDRERIEAWLNGEPFKENSRDKTPKVPDLTTEQIMEMYVPEYISDGAKFYTPLEMAEMLFRLSSVNFGYLKILEPCAGIGNLIYAVETWAGMSTNKVEAWELDQEAFKIGAKLFSYADWHYGCALDNMSALAGKFNLVLMNPPFGTTWGTYLDPGISVSGATKSEHLFLELAVRALAPGGIGLIIAPWSYLTKLPKALKKWFDERVGEWADLGELPGEFRFTGVKVHGWEIHRNDFDQPTQEESKEDFPIADENAKEVEIDLPGSAKPISAEIIEGNTPVTITIPVPGPAVSVAVGAATSAHQLSLEDLLPAGEVEPVYSGNHGIADLLLALGDVKFYVEPDNDLLESVGKYGVLPSNPVIFTGNFDGHTFTDLKIRDGARRLQAAIKKAKLTVPIVVYPPDTLFGEEIGLISNLLRSDNPVTEFKALKTIIDTCQAKGISITISDLHIKTHLPVATIKRLMAFGGLRPEFLNAMQEGKIAPTLARKIAHQTAKVQAHLLDKLADTGKLTGNDLHEERSIQTAKAVTLLPAGMFSEKSNFTMDKLFDLILNDERVEFGRQNGRWHAEYSPVGLEHVEALGNTPLQVAEYLYKALLPKEK